MVVLSVHFFVSETEKSHAATSRGNMADAQKLSHCALQGPMYSFVAVQKKPAVSCTFFPVPFSLHP
jgi:hypothetical protein